MEKKQSFTNEKLSKKFKSNFDLVNYAISLAENMIKSGRDARVKSDVQNRAMLVLEEISEGKDQFDEIPEPAPTQQNTASFSRNEVDHRKDIFREERAERAERAERRKTKAVLANDDED